MEHRTCATPGPKGTDSVLRNQRRGKGKKGGRERKKRKGKGRERDLLIKNDCSIVKGLCLWNSRQSRLNIVSDAED